MHASQTYSVVSACVSLHRHCPQLNTNHTMYILLDFVFCAFGTQAVSLRQR